MIDEQISIGENDIPNNNVSEQSEKLFTRDQLAKIVNAESTKAADIARRKAEEKYQKEIEELNLIKKQQELSNSNVSKEVDADKIYEKVQERFNNEIQEYQQKAHMNQIAQSYLSKIDAAKGSYEDFDEITKDFDPTAFPQLTFLLAGIDNAGDILYDLSKNPLKLAGIDRLAERNPKQAHSELMKLSRSINDNKQAQLEANNSNIPEPLDRLQPSRVSRSNGKMSISDLRKVDYLKG